MNDETAQALQSHPDNKEDAAFRGADPSASTQALGCAIAGIMLLVPVVLYFGFFAAILVDEALDTSYLAPGNFPRPVVEGIELIYAPLFEVVESFD